MTSEKCRCAYCGWCAPGYDVCTAEGNKNCNHTVSVNSYRKCPDFAFVELHVDTGKPYKGERLKDPETISMFENGGDL